MKLRTRPISLRAPRLQGRGIALNFQLSVPRGASGFALNLSLPRGFTLLELVVVLFIMAVFLSMAALSFQSVTDQEVLEKPAAALQRTVREAMRHASIYEEPEVVVFDKHGFGVRYRTEADTAGQGGGTWQQHTELPESMTILVKHWGQTEWQPAAGQKWQVLASGLCEPLSVRLDRGHSYVEMQFNPLTGGVVDKRLVILP